MCVTSRSFFIHIEARPKCKIIVSSVEANISPFILCVRADCGWTECKIEYFRSIPFGIFSSFVANFVTEFRVGRQPVPVINIRRFILLISNFAV